MEPIMTLHECCEALRANQVPASEDVWRQIILEQRVPFALGVQKPNSSRSIIYIYRGAFYKWLREMTQGEVVEI